MSEDSECDDTAEARRSYLDAVAHIKELGILPQKEVVMPYEMMTIGVTDAVSKGLIADAKKEEINLGIVEQIEGEKGLMPPVGSIGVGANILEINDFLGAKQLVKLDGIIRFTIDKYVNTDKP